MEEYLEAWRLTSMKRCVVSVTSALIALVLPVVALAGVGEELESVPEISDPAIYNGSEVGLCGWPTTVHVANGGSWCTGTLIHPRVVVYAAHCGASPKQSKAYVGTSTVVLEPTSYRSHFK